MFCTIVTIIVIVIFPLSTHEPTEKKNIYREKESASISLRISKRIRSVFVLHCSIENCSPQFIGKIERVKKQKQKI